MSCICHEGELYMEGETIPCFYCGSPNYTDMFDNSIGVCSILVFPLNNTLKIGLPIGFLPEYTLNIAYYVGNKKHIVKVKDSETMRISPKQFLLTEESKHMLNLYKREQARSLDDD